MQNPVLFCLPGAEHIAGALQQRLECERGELDLHRFPDGETCPRLMTNARDRPVIFVAALDQPDARLLALYLCACTARELGAHSVGLILPYLPYMRQDMRFARGEGITSRHIARLLSGCCDWLVTIDPHLHRYHSLSEIYTARARAVPAAPAIAHWIGANVAQPLLIGPDRESAQWVSGVAQMLDCPYTVLEKNRTGDTSVAVSAGNFSAWPERQPVLLDDIISSGRTLIAAAQRLQAAGMAAPICIGVHALFAGDAWPALKAARIERIVTCNTIDHPSNAIDVSDALARAAAVLVA